MPLKKRHRRNSQKDWAKLEPSPKMAFVAREYTKIPFLPLMSARAPHTQPPTIIPVDFNEITEKMINDVTSSTANNLNQPICFTSCKQLFRDITLNSISKIQDFPHKSEHQSKLKGDHNMTYMPSKTKSKFDIKEVHFCISLTFQFAHSLKKLFFGKNEKV